MTKVTDLSSLIIGRPVTITVTRSNTDDASDEYMAVGQVVSYGRERRANGTVKSWVALGNDTSAHPTIAWSEDRYHTVDIVN